jgi:hypothetical protein
MERPQDAGKLASGNHFLLLHGRTSVLGRSERMMAGGGGATASRQARLWAGGDDSTMAGWLAGWLVMNCNRVKEGETPVRPDGRVLLKKTAAHRKVGLQSLMMIAQFQAALLAM